MIKKISFRFLYVLLFCFIGMISLQAQNATVEGNTIQQYIRGFDGVNIIGWRDDLSSADRVTAFSVDNGIGMSMLRIRVSPDSADWSSNQATINAARSCGASVIASAWSTPALMKTNNNTNGGNLKTSSYADYAVHLRIFCNTVGEVLWRLVR